MNGPIAKVLNNVLSPQVAACLGLPLYGRYLLTFAALLPRIIKSGDLRPLDEKMGRFARFFSFRSHMFVFDCGYADRISQEASFAFGLAREIYIRDCYFKWHPEHVFLEAKTVVDLGANRGAFAAMMTTRANFILAVECQNQYRSVIEHNFRENRFENYAIEHVFVGAGGMFDDGLTGRYLAVSDLLAKNGLKQIDFMKIDIEGSEFKLFEEPDWLARIRALTLEVHPQFGSLAAIIDVLQQAGFEVVMADENLRKTTGREPVSYLYAYNHSLVRPDQS